MSRFFTGTALPAAVAAAPAAAPAIPEPGADTLVESRVESASASKVCPRAGAPNARTPTTRTPTTVTTNVFMSPRPFGLKQSQRSLDEPERGNSADCIRPCALPSELVQVLPVQQPADH